MTKILGILPAGGEAVRFNGLTKELLPVSQTDCSMTRAIRAMLAGGAEQVVVCTSWLKIGLHMKAVEGLPVHFIVRDFAGVWETIAAAGEMEADWYYFAMPDTVFPLDAFCNRTGAEVEAGLFHTDKPERFGVMRRGRIEDKRQGPPGEAWGVWILARPAMNYLKRVLPSVRDHTTGLNMLLERLHCETFPLEYYYDFASFDDYLEFLCSMT